MNDLFFQFRRWQNGSNELFSLSFLYHPDESIVNKGAETEAICGGSGWLTALTAVIVRHKQMYISAK